MQSKILNKDVFWYTLGLTFNSFNSLFFLIFINRINGVNEAGMFSYGFSIACLLFVIGIYQGRVFQVSDTSSGLKNKEYLAHRFITCGLMILLSFIFICVRRYSFEKNIIIILMCLYKCVEAFEETFYAYLQKDNKLFIVGKSMLFKSLVGLVVFLLVDLVTHNLPLACIFLFFNSLAFLFFYDLKHSYRYINSEKVDWNHVFRLFILGFSVFGFSFLSVYIVNIPKYIIDFLLTDAAQTVFSIIVMPGTVVSLCGQYITAPVLNQMVCLYQEKKYKSFNNLVFKIVGLLIFLGILIEICAWLLGIPVLSIIYGINLNAYKIDLILILVGALFYAVAGIISNALITMRKNNVQLIIYIIDALLGAAICYFLILKMGIHGATYGYLLTMLVHVLLYMMYYIYNMHKLVTH